MLRLLEEVFGWLDHSGLALLLGVALGALAVSRFLRRPCYYDSWVREFRKRTGPKSKTDSSRDVE